MYSTAYDSVRVEFSEDVDTASATSALNYSITGLPIASVAMTANPKAVRLTTDTQLHKSYSITISSVKDLNGNAMTSSYNSSFQGAVEEPRVANVTAVKNNQVLVEYSENVSSAAGNQASYTINPAKTISGVTFPYNGSSSFALLTLSSGMENTGYTLEVTGDVQDGGGFSMHPLYKEQSFQGDALPRIAMVNSASINSIRLKFTEDVDQATAETEGNYSTELAAGGGSLPITTVTRDAVDPSIFLIDRRACDLSRSLACRRPRRPNGS